MHPRESILDSGLLTLFFVLTLATTSLSGQYYSNAVSAKSAELPKGILFDVSKEALSALHHNKSQTLELSLPSLSNTELNLELVEFQIHSAGFSIVEKSELGVRTVPYTKGRYYKGIVVGEPHSQAFIAIHSDEVSGVIILSGDKKINVGKLRDSDQHFIYEAKALAGMEAFPCGTLPNYDIITDINEEKKKMTGCTTAVDIYIECDYQMYQNFSSNTTSVTNYVNTLFAEVAVLYASENITLQLSQVTVWSTNDGYSSGTAGLSSFANALNSSGFNGDLAHLLTNDTGANGGVAYVDQLCGTLPYAYSDILNTSHPVPTYSWDVQVVAHELGHNFGSSHTHDCVWGPNNNQQIDDCGNLVLGGGSCYNPSTPIIPASGGTIMSYCHLNGVGINFNNGFGVEPGDLIRANYATCMCDNSTCDSALEISTTGTYTAKPSSGGGATSSQATNADWFKFTPSSNGTIDIASCNEGVDTRVWVYSGTCSNLVFEATSDDDCTSAGTNTYASEIIGLNVISGTDYFIEWDDRWSTATFDWMFTYTPTSGSTVTISCPSQYIAENTCDPSDYAPAASGSASGATGSIITYSDVITTTSCTIDINRTWTATMGNSTADCIQNIALEDTTSPVLQICPVDLTVTSESDCKAFVTWPTPSAVDACSASLVTTSNYTSGGYFSVGTYSINYTITDSCLNSTICAFQLTVLDGCTVVGGLPPCDGVHLNLTGNLDEPSYRAKTTLECAGTILSGSTTLLTAGQSMELGPGFEIGLGATLEANIEDCQN